MLVPTSEVDLNEGRQSSGRQDPPNDNYRELRITAKPDLDDDQTRLGELHETPLVHGNETSGQMVATGCI